MALYRFCPLCGTDLEIITIDQRGRPKCRACGFVYYHNPVPAAGCVVFQKGKLLLVQRAHTPYIGDWTIPAGFCEWEENPSETARRELKEETGLEVKVTGLFKVYNGQDDPRTNAILILYFADAMGGILRAADDALTAKFYGINELPGNIAFEAHRQALADLKAECPERFHDYAD